MLKTKRNQKWKIPHTVLGRQTLCFSSYKNRKLKVKLWWDGARKREKRVFFVPFILSEGNFFNICVLSQCRVYWMRFQNIHTFTYQRALLHTLICLFLKFSKPCILKSFGISLGNFDITCLLLINTLRLTCGKNKIWSNIKIFQNIITMIVDTKFQLKQAIFIFWVEFSQKRYF